MKNIVEMYDAEEPPSLYLHIPFCKYKCAYCAFYSTAYGSNLKKKHTAYFDRMLREAEFCRSYFKKPFPTVYIGGGTPNIECNMPFLKRLIGILADPSSEFTVECNISSLNEEQLDFFSGNISRMSVGIQSFSAGEREIICRCDATDNISMLMQKRNTLAGFPELNLDFITGITDSDTFSNDFTRFAELCRRNEWTLPEHISLYLLTVENGSRYEKMISDGKRNAVDSDTAADILQNGWKTLEMYGYDHYEISAFALEDRQCRHNLNYWNLGNYLGLGASAASRCFNAESGYAFDFKPDWEAYAEGSPFSGYEIENLSALDVAVEMIATGMRTEYGVDISLFGERTGIDLPALCAGIPALNISGGRVFLNRSDFIIAEHYIKLLVNRL